MRPEVAELGFQQVRGKQTVPGQKWTQLLAKDTVSLTTPTLSPLLLCTNRGSGLLGSSPPSLRRPPP